VRVSHRCYPGLAAATPAVSGKTAVAKQDTSGEVSDWETVSRLKRFVWGKDRDPQFKTVVVASGGLMLGAKVVNLGIPIIFKFIVDGMATLPTDPTGALWTVQQGCLAYGAVRVLSAGVNESKNLVVSRVAAATVTSVSTSVFEHLHALPLNYHLSRDTGALSRAIDRGARGVQWLMSQAVTNVAPTLFEILLVSGFLTYRLGPEFGLCTLGIIGVYSAYTTKVAAWRREVRKQMNDADSAAGSVVLDSLLNYETVKFFNKERFEVQRYKSKLLAYQKTQQQTVWSLSALNFGQQFIFSAGTAAMLALCAKNVANGTMTVGDTVMVQTLLMQVAMPLGWLGTMYSETRRSLIDVQSMFKLLDVPTMPPPDPATLTTLPDEPTLGVEFDNVTFSFKDKPILQGLSFALGAGQSLGVVGGSGSGKSTMLRLLFRFYDVETGAIRIGGRDIRHLTVDELRGALGVIPQDIVLFNDTLGYNIRYGNPDASDEEVQEVIRAASLTGTVARLPKGLDTMVGERGLKLSGGEKQRVGIARTLFKKPKVLLSDEATSALDSTTESSVTPEIRALTGTQIIVAHRLSTIQHCDQILVLDGGRCAEMGSHAELLQKDGMYAEMWSRQTSEIPMDPA